MSIQSDYADSTRRLDHAGWLLWGVTFTLLFSLSATLPALYAPLLEMLDRNGQQLNLPDAWVTSVSLLGLVLLFCLYTVVKQREIHFMRGYLEREARNHKDASARFSEVSAFFQLATTLHLQLKLDHVLEIIVRRVVFTMRAQQASIMLHDAEAQELVTHAAYGLESELSIGARERMGCGIAGWVALQREGILLGPRAPNDELARHYKPERAISSALSLPLTIGDRVIGVLNVNRINHPEAFNEHDLSVLQEFARHLAAVIEHAQALERLDSHARQLAEDNVKLVDLNRMKDVFLSTASHELKTPLSSVIAYSELLDDHEAKLTREQSREFVGRLRGEAMRLLGLIDDILDLSRLESGKMLLRTRLISLAEVAGGAVETTRPMAERHGVKLATDFGAELPELLLDEVKIRQVVVNLLVNAVKFSPKGGTVTLVARRDGNFARLEVSDHGPGVPAEQATQIFELFGQGPGESAGPRGGLGIGLHLVKRLTELHNGQVGVVSRVGEGSTFWARFPIRPAREAEGESVSRAA